MRETISSSVDDPVDWTDRLFKRSEQLILASRLLREDSNRLRDYAKALKLQRPSVAILQFAGRSSKGHVLAE